MRRSLALFLLPVLALLLVIAPPVGAADIETDAEEAILVDAETGSALFAKKPARPSPPASVTTLVPVHLLF